MSEFTMSPVKDMHHHPRDGKTTWVILPSTMEYASDIMVMPNIQPAVLDARSMRAYRDRIMRVVDATSLTHSFTLHMTIEVRDSTTPKKVREARRAGVIAGKIYPQGSTTNSEGGPQNLHTPKLYKTYQAMQDVGMMLLIHCEDVHDRILVTKREESFLPTLYTLAEKFPDLKIVMEHVSSRAGVEMVKQLGGNVTATITAHHLVMTLNDIIGDKIRPHNMCKPVPKDFDDLDAVVEAAIYGDQFPFGSDSAAHPLWAKECAEGACGVFSAPVALSLLVEVFKEAGALHRLADFTSGRAEKIYGLSKSEDTITIVEQDWEVPAMIGDFVPFLAGTTRHHKLK